MDDGRGILIDAVSGCIEPGQAQKDMGPDGMCLGHQILALALGCRAHKLQCGHRGGQPVKNLAADRVEITYQNTGFAVDKASLPGEVEMTHENLNDGTPAGLRHKTLPVFSVQYHPEAGVGTHDGSYLYDGFVGMMEKQ